MNGQAPRNLCTYGFWTEAIQTALSPDLAPELKIQSYTSSRILSAIGSVAELV